MVFALVACGSSNSNNPSTSTPGTSQPSGEAPTGVVAGTVVNFRLPVDMACLLPWAHATAANVYVQIYDTLFQPYKGDWNDIRGMLCTDYTMSEDGLTWVFQITDKATFSNGKKLTAQSIADCYDYTIKESAGSV